MDIITKALKDKIIVHLLITSIVYVFISIVITTKTHSFLNLMLGWNIILASLPVFFAYIFKEKIKEEKEGKLNKFILLTIFLLWLFFFPNSFYLITDFIHLSKEEFYYSLGRYSPTVYIENFTGYLTLIHIFLGAFIAIIMASYSLKIMHQFFIDKLGNIKAASIVLVILVLSSIGIYLGRFLRLQSWNMFNPIAVLSDFYDSLNMFVFEFVLIFTLVQGALYLFARPFLKIND